MSVLFYRRPNYSSPLKAPLTASDCDVYVKRASASARAIPPGLSFEEVINKKTLPPCTVNDFLDYLVYVEHSAQNLQFYLWYQDYLQRWDALPEKERELSPEWTEETEVPVLAGQPSRQGKKRPSAAPIPIRPHTPGDLNLTFDDAASVSYAPSAFSSPSARTNIPTDAEASEQAGLKWQGFTVQPFRDEINRIIRHYLAAGAPRELNMSSNDRTQILHALQHTTHPSALAIPVRTTTATLRGQSHPNFVRWSICNGNRPKIFAVRTAGIVGFLLGCAVAVVLVKSSASRWYRLFAAPLWFAGLASLIAAFKGLCLILHHGAVRNLRPWELGEDDLEEGYSVGHDDGASVTAIQLGTAGADDKSAVVVDDGRSTRANSFSTFGPSNKGWETASWVSRYERRGLISRVFEKSVWTQDETLRLLQDRIVLGANLWAAMGTLLLTALFVALPGDNLF